MDLIHIIKDSIIEQFNNEVNGTVTKYGLGGHLLLTELEFETCNKVNLTLLDGQHASLQFIYILEGQCSVDFPDAESKKKLDAYQSVILYDKNGKGNASLNFMAHTTYKLCIIQLLKRSKQDTESPLFEQFEIFFNATNQSEFSLDQCLPNIKICEQVNKLLELPKLSLSNNLMALGYLHIILGIKLKEYQDGLNQPKCVNLLNVREIEQIQMIVNRIIKNPEMPYSIDGFCKATGLSAYKLQEGFKDMHNKTVANFIIHTRLKKAEELMKTSDLNISQIVYSIGLSSRSYFSRVFKQQYHCTPKDYQQRLYSLAVTA